MSLLVVAGTRPPEGESRDPTLVAELIADPEVVAIRPEPLGRASIAVLARELHGLEPDEAFCAALQTATGGNPLFVGAVLDAVAREGTSPTAEHAARLLEIGAQGVARVVGLRLARLRPAELALLRAPRSWATGSSYATRPRSPAWKQVSLARPPPHWFGLTSSVARIRWSSSTPSSAAPSTRRWMWSSEGSRTARPPNCCSTPAPRPRVRRCTCCVWPHKPTRSWSRPSAKRPSVHSPRAQPMPRSGI